jgi:hypothetical protein
MSNAKQFEEVVKGKNFMTPDVVRFGQQGDYVYELSKGEFLGDEIYGVTVVDLRTKSKRDDLSSSFQSYEQANDYINDLEKQA